MKDILTKYKYLVTMQPAQNTIEYAKKKFLKEKFEDLLNNKLEVLISPVYIDNNINKKFYQVLFDIDFTLTSPGSALVFCKKILYNIRNTIDPELKHTIVEYTGSGLHIVSNIAYEITEEDLKELRLDCRMYTRSVDCISSFRDVPVRRIGGFKNFVIVPVDPKLFFATKLPQIPQIKKHLDYASKETWYNYLDTYLFPKKFVRMNSRKVRVLLKSLINVG